MKPFIKKLIRENLDIPVTVDLQIEGAHCALAPRPPAGAQPRSNLVKFLSFGQKEDMIKLAWQKRGFTWKNSKIYFDHDDTPAILGRRRDYAEAQRILKGNNIRFQILYPAG